MKLDDFLIAAAQIAALILILFLLFLLPQTYAVAACGIIGTVVFVVDWITHPGNH